MLETIGFRFVRRGKGDHTLYARGDEIVIIAGSPNRELKKGAWETLRKRFDLGEQ
jgi:predicted RNA binding protein YcfA (HicA-like mRNA interferase family)